MVKDLQSVRGVNCRWTDCSLYHCYIDPWFAEDPANQESHFSLPIYSTCVPKTASSVTSPLTRSIAAVYDIAEISALTIILAFGGHAVTTCMAFFSAKHRSILGF